jgi:peroxiredoxin Q/BCP
MAIAEGKPAPLFTLETLQGQKVALKDLRGKKVVLYFYPKDDTPGCTAQACAFRDAFPNFKSANATILGISPDTVKSHEKFAAKFSLPFPLLADPNHLIADKYGVWKEKSMYGRKYMGVERTTFLINEQGRIVKIFPKVKVPGHFQEVLQALVT